MSDFNVVEILENILLSVPEYVSENGKVLKAKVYEDTMAVKPELIKLLLSSEQIKKLFFVEVDGITVFDKQKFAWLLENKEFLPDSYTRYINKIGLSDKSGKLITKSDDVVLSFPYKDCVLVGGQDKDDEKRDEIFFNDIIGSQQITRMLEPKVFTNAKRYTKDGIENGIEFQDDDNLIIKGNNLIVLSSLLEKYEGSVKSICIDPPYYFSKNKKDDSFNYNSNFKLSTWLTFMKNRIAQLNKLLSDDGFLIIIIGKDGYAHLKVLCDDLFSVSKMPNNYVGTISWRKTDNQSNVGDFANVIDYILIYKKSNEAKLNRLPLTDKAKKEYTYEDSVGKYRRANLLDKTRGRYNYEIKTPDGYSLNGPWMIEEADYLNKLKKDEIHWPKEGMQIPYGKTYLKDSIEKGQITSDLWDASYGTNQRSADEIKQLFNNKRIFDYSKPESLIMNLLSLTSNKGDLVLDCFLGSGTTIAVAQKMDRKFIGIEQMDYIEDISVVRMRKVIEVSKVEFLNL